MNFEICFWSIADAISNSRRSTFAFYSVVINFEVFFFVFSAHLIGYSIF